MNDTKDETNHQREVMTKIEEQDEKLEAIWHSVEKTRKYFLWTFWATIVAFVLPLVGLAIVIPMAMNSYVDALGGGEGAGAFQGLI